MKTARRFPSPRWAHELRAAALISIATFAAGALPAVDVGAPLEVVVVVAENSSVQSLSRSALADLFLGRTSRFPGGQAAVPIDQREGSAARDAFYSEWLGRTPAQVKAHWSKVIFTGRGSPPRAVADSDQLRRVIARDPSAIGYLERSAVNRDLRIVRID